MKIRTIITLMGAGVAYVLTVAIAWDQIRQKNKECAVWKQKFEIANTTIKKMGRAVDKHTEAALEASKGASEKMEKLKTDLPKLIEDAKLQGRLEAINERIQQAAKAEAIAETARSTRITNPSRPPQPYMPPSPVVQTASAPSEHPYWKTYQGVGVMKGIRAEAEKKWGTDYSMVEYQIKSQKEAFEKLLEYRKSYDRVTKGIVEEAQNHWGTDYQMVVYQIKEQLGAKSRLDGR